MTLPTLFLFEGKDRGCEKRWEAVTIIWSRNDGGFGSGTSLVGSKSSLMIGTFKEK